MSTPALDIVRTAAIRIGDASYRAVSIDSWLSILNERARRMCTRLKLKKRRWLFSTEANNEVYAPPQNLIQLTEMEFTTTPLDRTTFRPLGELFEEEFRQAKANSYPTGDPTGYFMDQGWFWLYPMPTVFYANGVRATGWALPDTITDIASQNLPFADSFQDVLLAGMLSEAYSTLEKYDKAQAQEQKYERIIEESELRLEDRADDRRARMRPRSNTYSGQV